MKLSTYIMILFSVSLFFYLVDYQPIAFETILSSIGNEPLTIRGLINLFFSIFQNEAFLLVLAGSLVTAFLLGGSNFSLVYLVPIFLLLMVTNIFVFPTSFLFDSAIPFLMRVIIGMLFNVFLLLVVVEFIKGGEV